jgi:enoyl-CoA hydratase/carnithine racemase
LNALTKPMWKALGDAIDALSANDDLRCIVIRGAGEKAFSPGNDIAEFATERANKAQAIEYGRVMHATARALTQCRHPLVAQIHGICVGGGLEIASLCDLRICGESSRFGAPIKNLGLVMAYPEMSPLVRIAGTDVALEILLEGRIFGAAEAKEKRLVTRVVHDNEVAAEALATAQRIAEGAPLVARWHKQFARRLADPRPLTEAEFDACFDCFDTEDFRIGYAAFLAKQKPLFVGK